MTLPWLDMNTTAKAQTEKNSLGPLTVGFRAKDIVYFILINGNIASEN